MKKSLVSALTTALVVGAASTTFAAANPFSDVPADHWAYDAVAQLAAEGVVDGYGDGSFRGEQEITRYEMAQMVAKAMAKGVNSAVLDKLAAEFAEELNQLGVRVAALEKKVDNVKFTGELRYRYSHASSKNGDHRDLYNSTNNKNELLFRLDINAEVNKNWKVVSRTDYGQRQDMKTSSDVTSVSVDRMYAEGKYKFGTIQLGKFNVKTNADFGLVSDDTMTGISFETGKVVKAKAFGGRYHLANFGKANSGNVWGIEVFGKAKKLSYGIGYTQTTLGEDKNDKGQILAAGLGYKFTKSVAVEAAYARNMKNKAGAAKLSSAERTRMAFTLKYKGADKAKVGSYGLWVGYRNIGKSSGLYSTYRSGLNADVIDDLRGMEYGAQVTLAKNIMAQARYFNGNSVSKGKDKVHGFFGQVDFFF